MRYLRATQYISFDKKTFRMIVAPSRKDEVDYILTHVERNASEYNTVTSFKKYIFNPNSLLLLTDNRDYLVKQLLKLSATFDTNAEIELLKDILEKKERTIISDVIRESQFSLKNYQEFDDIINVFGKIQSREVPDPPLYLEWNIWRSMVMLNYAKHVTGNFRFDLDGIPLNTALGNMPDIEIGYNGFKVIVEVTMSTGSKQYEMEGEPVSRHFGNIQRNSEEPVYCIFIAPKISEWSQAYFFNLNRMNTKAYGGKTRIIPMSLNHFISFITTAKNNGFSNPKTLQGYLDSIINKNRSIDDESMWIQYINESINTWVN